MELYIMRFEFKGSKVERLDTPKLRGFFANKFPQYLEMHNHIEDNKFNYDYPSVQYKAIGGVPNVFAINNSGLTLYKIMSEVDKLELGNKLIDVLDKCFVVKKCNFGLSEKMIKYKFLSPWMALNQKNYSIYKDAVESERKKMLEKLIAGNILSVAKSLGYWLNDRIEATVDLKSIDVNYKDKKMIAFKGTFLTNFHIPDYLGIGKSVSRGFGTVKKDI